jgi:excisionase family DNA binding protein
MLTVAEVAEFLHVRQRTIYELVRTKRIPNNLIGGKLAFPRELVELWVSQFPRLRCSGEHAFLPPQVIVGSHDPLLEWSVHQSGSDLAIEADGDIAGIERLLAGDAAACALHLIDPATSTYDASVVAERLAGLDLAVIESARRRQGIFVAPGNPAGIRSIKDLAESPIRVAIPPKGSGTAVLLSKLLTDAGLMPDSIKRSGRPVRSDAEAAQVVVTGDLDAGFGIEAVAHALPMRWGWISSLCIGNGSISLCATPSSSKRRCRSSSHWLERTASASGQPRSEDTT